MTNSDDLVELVARAITEMVYNFGTDPIAREVARAAIAAMREWKPIETAPNDDEVWILGCSVGSKLPVPCCFDPDDGWVPLNNVFKNWKPTHWMPLPEPPKDTANE